MIAKEDVIVAAFQMLDHIEGYDKVNRTVGQRQMGSRSTDY